MQATRRFSGAWRLAAIAALIGGCDRKGDQAPPPPAAQPLPASAPVDGWVTFTPKDGGFTVRLPGTPKEESQKVPTALGELDLHMASYEAPGQNVYVAVSWNALPQLAVEVGETEKMLDGGAAGMLSNAGLTPEAPAAAIALGDHPGRDVRGKGVVEGISVAMRGRAYVVHDRLFQIVVLTMAGTDYAAETEKVFASFALTPEFARSHEEVTEFEWKEYRDPGGRYTAKFPVAAPRVTVEPQTVNGVEFTQTTVVGSAERSYAVFMLGHFDLPAEARKASTPDQLFELGRNGAAGAIKAKIVGAPEKAALGDIPGEKFTLESEGGLMNIECRAYLQGERFYYLMALRPRNSKVAQAELDEFFAGFAPTAARAKKK
jgi:hypothetical protein